VKDNDADDETLKDEMAQQYKAIQSQQLQLPYQHQPTTGSDVQMMKKKSASRSSIKKFFGK